ncbi:hypothetical protein [Coraliomargarita parva]|uniref:hypothetical protein n=1 Tax=Coraliomargarita parva TaxID=3014050 RepID=UPI0022B32B26|nr:hypothetical protein [Coraliomargarita parva]
MNRVILLLICIISAPLLAEENVDPFAPPADWKLEDKPELTICIYTINRIHSLPKGTPESYKPMDEYDEEMNQKEMAILRYLQEQGVDFIGIQGSLVCLPETSRKATAVMRLQRYHIIVKQTKENQEKVTKIFRQFEPDLEAEPVSIVNDEAAPHRD